jgi:2-hydroxychromene-2-carboxylate isomerase
MSQPDTSFAFTAVLSVCIDFTNPHAYLAIEPTRALENRLSIVIDWLPVRVAPLERPAPARAGDARGTRHRRIRALYSEQDLARHVQARGITLGNIYRDDDTTRAAIGLLWVRRHAAARAGAYVARIFDLVWQERADIAQPAVVESVLAGLGVRTASFAAFAGTVGAAELSGVQRGLGAAGIFNVPAYVLDGEVFYGRQHLPLLESLLLSRQQ